MIFIIETFTSDNEVFYSQFDKIGFFDLVFRIFGLEKVRI